ncbi:MAG: hypothetical protein IKJ59_02620 [Clostridia bacterium]|nr:hypothetical protein [Clostridia bacterium]
MNKSIKKAVVTVMTLASMGCMCCINAFAANSTVTLEVNQAWTYVGPVSRSGRYDYLAMRNLAVYPRYGGTDNFRYIQAYAIDDYGNVICETITLDERDESASYPYIYELHHNVSSIRFGFRGNNPNYEAKADVVYNGM